MNAQGIYSCFTVSLAVGLLTLGHQAQCETPSDDAQGTKEIRRYLTVKYDEFEKRPGGEQVVLGLSYNENEPLVLIEIPELMAFLPKTRFFGTRLMTSHHEYPKVELVVAITRTTSGDDIRTCLSPTYNDASPKFLCLFEGLLANSPEQKRQLTIGLGKVLAAVTHKGEVRGDKTDSVSATVELWHGDLYWRNVTVTFDKNGNSEHVLILNPRKE